jgi:hypothetical protein
LYALGATLIHLLTGTAPADLPQQDLRIQFADRVSIDANFIRWIEVLTEPELKARFSSAPEALEALTTGRYLASISRIIPQPTRNRIQLSKSKNQFSIELKVHNQISMALILLAIRLPVLTLSLLLLIGIMGVMTWVIILLLSSLMSAISTGGLIALVVVGIMALTGWVICQTSIFVANNLIKGIFDFRRELFKVFGHQYIVWNKDYLEKGWKLFYWRYRQAQGQTSKIKTIQSTPSKLVMIEKNGKSYSFGQNLTFAERDWLAQEIQDWLNNRE